MAVKTIQYPAFVFCEDCKMMECIICRLPPDRSHLGYGLEVGGTCEGCPSPYMVGEDNE